MNASEMATKLTYALTATKKGAIAPRLRDYMHSLCIWARVCSSLSSLQHSLKLRKVQRGLSRPSRQESRSETSLLSGLDMRMLMVWSVTAIFLTGCIPSRENSATYMVALNPDGSRVAIGKNQKGSGWELLEGNLQQSLRLVSIPSGVNATGAFNYAPDGNDLFYATTSSEARVPADKPSQASGDGRIGTTETLWRQRLGDDETSPPIKLFEHAGFSNLLPLLDGSIVFMGAVRLLKSHPPTMFVGHRGWTNYGWMLRKPDGSMEAISPREYAFFSSASLIRDEAVFFIQESRRGGQSLNPREYEVDSTALKPGVNLSAVTRLGTMQDSRGGPRLLCDWAGRTCARVMTYNKDGYFAHQLEIIQDGRVCKVSDLPDRLEQFSIARNGSAIALITRPNPYREVGYQLAHVTIDESGCAGEKKFFALP